MARRQKWKDKLRPAQFRGLAFYIDVSSFGTGRRGTTHEFPGKDIPYREDLGRKAKTYPIEGYVLGSDYRTQRDKIIKACEKEGPGDLVHPFYGKVKVCCEALTVTETAGEGGFAKLSFQFVEAGEVSFPSSLLDTGFLVGAAAGLLGDNAVSAFSDSVSIVGQTANLVESVANKVSDFADSISDFTAGATGAANDIANLAFAIRDLKANIRDLLATPAILAAQMNNAYDLLAKALNPSDLFKAVNDLFSFGSSDVTINRTTAGRAQQATNLEAVNTLVNILAISKASVAATQIDFGSTQDAVAARDAITRQIDAQSLQSADGNDEVYNSLQSIRAEVVRAVPAPDSNLASIAEFTPLTTMPALAVVYDRYGSIDLLDDVIARNNIMHPGFIRGGVVLEVLDSV